MTTTQPTLEPSHTPDIGALIAAHVQRAAALKLGMTWLLTRVSEPVQQRA